MNYDYSNLFKHNYIKNNYYNLKINIMLKLTENGNAKQLLILVNNNEILS